MSYLSFLSLFFVTLVVVDSLDRLRYVLLVAIGSVGLGLASHPTRVAEVQRDGGRVSSGLGHRRPKLLQRLRASVPSLAFSVFRTDQPRWERWFCLGSIGLILVGLILAASRGALIGLTAASLLAVGSGGTAVEIFSFFWSYCSH